MTLGNSFHPARQVQHQALTSSGAEHALNSRAPLISDAWYLIFLSVA